MFAFFLAKHFLLSYGLGGDFRDRFKDDKEVLTTMKEQTGKILEEVTGIRMWTFQYLQKVVDGCIRRCDGDRNAMSEYM